MFLQGLLLSFSLRHHSASDKCKAAFNASHVGLQRHGALCVLGEREGERCTKNISSAKELKR